jgi:glycosyltransferase involved in cell wall biosynthesis
VLVSGSPFSSFPAAARLARSARLPLVLDYRDEWGISNAVWENKRLGRFSRYVQGRMQARVVRAAGGLVATTRHSAATLDAVRAACGGRAKVTWVYNGYDTDDFAAASAPCSAPERFRIAYVGTLWNLTSVSPLVDAVCLLDGRDPGLAAGLELVFVGRRTGPQEEQVARLRRTRCTLTERPYIDHSEAVALMRGSGAPCLLLSDLPGAGRVVPAKFFEYLATGRPILTIAPKGEAWDLLRPYPGAVCFEPKDVAGIAA